MLGWVCRGARKSTVLDRLIVATDSEVILSYCRSEGYSGVLTSSHHSSGTDRLVEVMEREAADGCAADVYVNIQGDEPMVSDAHIALLIKGLEDSLGNSGAVQVSTLKVPISAEAAADPNAVKVVTDPCGWALYFSRAPIPYHRDAARQTAYYKHLGFYAYTTAALRRFQTLAPTPLEKTEGLEQLRFLENGIPIKVIETHQDTIGVDTEDDLRRVEEILQREEIGNGK